MCNSAQYSFHYNTAQVLLDVDGHFNYTLHC